MAFCVAIQTIIIIILHFCNAFCKAEHQVHSILEMFFFCLKCKQKKKSPSLQNQLLEMLTGTACIHKIIHVSKQYLGLQIFFSLLDSLMMTKAILQITQSFEHFGINVNIGFYSSATFKNSEVFLCLQYMACLPAFPASALFHWMSRF